MHTCDLFCLTILCLDLQLVLIICGFHTWEFTSSLKRVGNLQISMDGAFVVTHWRSVEKFQLPNMHVPSEGLVS
jgi:hypothetical protein